MTVIPNKNTPLYEEQLWNAANFLENYLELNERSGLKILEIGSAEGGVLKYFTNKGNQCFGIEYSRSRFELARALDPDSRIQFVCGDITDTLSYANQLKSRFDVVICCDVIEHIPGDKKGIALINLKNLLTQDGRLLISFPPKYSPFAGHQQGIPDWTRWIPYLFLLPDKIYSACLNWRGVREAIVASMLATKHSRLSINQFEKMVSETGLRIIKKDYFLIRPRFEYHYGIRRLGHRCNAKIIREIFNFGAVYLLRPCVKY